MGEQITAAADGVPQADAKPGAPGKSAGIPQADAKPGAPAQNPATPPSCDRSTPTRRPGLNEQLDERWAQEWLKAADVIYASDGSTGERRGLFYGDPEIESLPIDPNRPSTWPAIVEFPVDREADDLGCLAEAVRLLKGWCCYVGDLRKRLKEPGALDDLRYADLIFAVDSWTGERCGLFYGDPATESLPIDHLQPCKAPVVLEIEVNHGSDDREVLAEAVGLINGWCCYPPDEEEHDGTSPRPDPEIS